MKTVTMLEFRRNAAAILKRVARGERLLLSHRGKPVARLNPLINQSQQPGVDDPFATVAHRARPSPKGLTPHTQIDNLLYG